MKRISPIFSITLFILIFGCSSEISSKGKSSLSSDTAMVNSNQSLTRCSQTLQILKKLEKKYDHYFWLALFSINEYNSLRFWDIEGLNLSIGQLDLLQEEVINLDLDQRNKMTTLLAENINKRGVSVQKLSKRITYWSLGKQQFELFESFNSFSLELLIEGLFQSRLLEKMLQENYLSDNQTVSSLSSYQMNQVYFDALNHISKMPEKEQLFVYSSLYSHFSSIK
jgi:hypothetical protein